MRKNYYALFGTTTTPLPDLAKILYDKLDLVFVLHESDYFGVYYKYSGMYADKITLEANFNTIENDWKEKDFRQYPVLIYVAHIQGRNTEKLSKSRYLKNVFPQMAGIKLLKEEIIEDSNLL